MNNKVFYIIIGLLFLIIVVEGILILLPSKKITISFNTMYDKEISDIKIPKNSNTDLPVLHREGYEFVGWKDKSVLVNNNYIFKESTVLVAEWKKVKTEFTITFNTNGGSEVSSTKLSCDDYLKLSENPTKEGYTFVEWKNVDGEPVKDGDKLSCEDIILYASWSKNSNKTSKPTATPKPTTRPRITPTPVATTRPRITPTPVATTRPRITPTPVATTRPRITPTPRPRITPTPTPASSNETYTLSFNTNGAGNIPSLQFKCGDKFAIPSGVSKSGQILIYWKYENNRPIANGEKLECRDITLTANWVTIPTGPRN